VSEIKDRRFMVRVPGELIVGCGPKCVVGVQGASDLRTGQVTVTTEGSAVLTVDSSS
jgi:hypothetical protein